LAMSLENEHPARVVIIGYAFNSLDPAQALTVETHISTCPECQALVAKYQARSARFGGSEPVGQSAPDQLAVPVEPSAQALPAVAPPMAQDEARIQGAPLMAQEAAPIQPTSPMAQEEAPIQAAPPAVQAPVPTPSARLASSALPTQPLPPRSRMRRLELNPLNIGLGLVILLLLVANLLQLNQARLMRDEQNDLIRTIQSNQVINALASEPGIELLPISGPSGQGALLIEKNGTSAILFLRNLPLLDSAHTYQAWLIPASGAPVSAGTFHANTGTPFASFLINAGQPLTNYSAINVTLEPSEGSSAPSTTPIIAVKL
jgi:hypothetical protein